MAQASKRRPWVVEMQPPGLPDWFAIDAFRSADEARMQASLARKRVHNHTLKAKFRYRDTREQEPRRLVSD
jgi:hypothetical protein